jgi:hypothetical protein
MAVAVLTYISPVLHKKVAVAACHFFFKKNLKIIFSLKIDRFQPKNIHFPSKTSQKPPQNGSKTPQNASKTAKIHKNT